MSNAYFSEDACMAEFSYDASSESIFSCVSAILFL